MRIFEYSYNPCVRMPYVKQTKRGKHNKQKRGKILLTPIKRWRSFYHFIDFLQIKKTKLCYLIYSLSLIDSCLLVKFTKLPSFHILYFMAGFLQQIVPHFSSVFSSTISLPVFYGVYFLLQIIVYFSILVKRFIQFQFCWFRLHSFLFKFVLFSSLSK